MSTTNDTTTAALVKVESIAPAASSAVPTNPTNPPSETHKNTTPVEQPKAPSTGPTQKVIPPITTSSSNAASSSSSKSNSSKTKQRKQNRSLSPNPSTGGGGGGGNNNNNNSSSNNNNNSTTNERNNAPMTAATIATMTTILSQPNLIEVLPALQIVMLSLASSKPSKNSILASLKDAAANTSNSNNNNNNAGSSSSDAPPQDYFTTQLIKSLKVQCAKLLNDNPPFVHLSTRDCAPQLTIVDSLPSSNNNNNNNNNTKKKFCIPIEGNTPSLTSLNRRMTIKGGMRGYRMVRATHGVSSGIWYYECLILDPPSLDDVLNLLPSNVRMGDRLKVQLKNALTKRGNKESAAAAKAQEENKKDSTSGGGGGVVSGVSGVSSRSNKRQRTSSNHNNTSNFNVGDDDDDDDAQKSIIGGNLRIGWSMRTGELQAPVGYDKWSYGYRDISGSRIHNSQREDKWGGYPYGPGDVVGFAICLVDEHNHQASSVSQSYNHSQQPTKKEKKNASNDVSSTFSNHIRFFKNGEAMGEIVISRGNLTGGEAFKNIQPGTYYPAISSYMGGRAKVNFGPYFICPPRHLPQGMKKAMKPMSDMCPPPSTSEEAMALFKKEQKERAGKSKRADEKVMNGVAEAVRVEAKLRHECYLYHLNRHVEEVREERMERGLSTGDLPSIPDEDMDGES